VLDQQIQLLAGTTDENLAAQRRALENQRDNAIKIALGQRRYEQYQQLHDPVYRDAVATAEQAGTPDAARIIYEISMASAAEQARINADTNLSVQQRSIELKRLELEQLQANTVLTGQELPPEPPPVPAPPKKILVLGPGDSAASLAAIYGVPISALRAANPNLDLTRLKPGDAVTIPANALVPGTTMTPPFPIR
jgi:LysM repeat protein